MKSIIAAFLLGSFITSAHSQTWTEPYTNFGKLIVVKLDSAPFPHPARAEGHKYSTEFFSAEKNYSDNTVAIFVPKGFRRTDKVDFVVHFHGWRNHVETVLSRYQLVQQFVESGRNAILVVPQGPYDAADSFDGKLEDEGGFKRFMNDVMGVLRENGVARTEPMGRIILSGHSGGYQVISSILAVGGMSDNIREVWLFDALYARTEKFTKWYFADGYLNVHRRMILIYTEHGGTKKETEALMDWVGKKKEPIVYLSKKEAEVTPGNLRGDGLIFIYTDMEHNDVLDKHRTFEEYLKTSRLESVKMLESPKASAR